MTDRELAEVNGRIEALLQEFGEHPDEEVAARVHELVRLLSGLYGAGLARIMTLVGAHPQGGAAVARRLGEDPLVGALLALHDLHPLDLQARVARALDEVRPFAALRGASLMLVAASGESVRVRLGLATPIGRAAAGDIAHAIREALGRLAPEVPDVIVDGGEVPGSPLIQIARGARAGTLAREG